MTERELITILKRALEPFARQADTLDRLPMPKFMTGVEIAKHMDLRQQFYRARDAFQMAGGDGNVPTCFKP